MRQLLSATRSLKKAKARATAVHWTLGWVSVHLLFFVSHQPSKSPGPDMYPPAAVALPHAHAHNDYQHDAPLWEALSCGFTSIEADVHLVGDELYLGHYLPQMKAEKTLRRAYLQPLNDLLARQNGKIYPNYDGVVYLMVDVKSSSVATYQTLRQQLQQFPLLVKNPHFKVFISGRRAVQQITQDPEHVAALDGRLSDLTRHCSAEIMPIISDDFRKYFKWRGKDAMPEEERSRLVDLVQAVHGQGKKLRFWAIPDRPQVWKILLEAGVDLINTDDLQGCQRFFTAQPDWTSPLLAR